MVRIDVRSQVITLRREDAERLRAAAAAAGATSSRRRDLALVLDWALSSPRVVALRRAEARELSALLYEDPALAHVGEAIADGHRRAPEPRYPESASAPRSAGNQAHR